MSKEKVIPFKVDYYDITGNHLSALVLVQLEYWQPKAFNGWISKKEEEWKQELRITYKMLQRIQDNLIKLGFIDVKQAMYSGRKTTHYRVNTAAITNAIEALKANPVLTKGKLDKRSILPKVNITKGELIDLPKVSSSIDQRSVLYTESTTESTTDTSFTDIKSVVDGLVKSEFMKKEMAEKTERNKAAAPKPKKPKEELSAIDKQIAEKVKYIADNFKLWHDKNKGVVYLHKDSDFVQLTKLFKQLCKKEGYTTDQVIADLNLIVSKFDKLPHFYQSNLNLTYIATNYQKLLLEIKNPKPTATTKPNYNTPVAHINNRLPEYYDGYKLPLGITAMQFEQLATMVMRENIIEGLIDENMRLSGFCQKYRLQLHQLTEQQLTQLLNDYEVI
jgi:hypothetical protein